MTVLSQRSKLSTKFHEKDAIKNSVHGEVRILRGQRLLLIKKD